MNSMPQPPTFLTCTEIKTYSIVELRPGMCACLVPVEPYPRYCGQPATRSYRMCETHAAAYLTVHQSRIRK